MVPLKFLGGNIMCVASNLSVTSGALGAEAIELCSWTIHYGCASEDLREVIDNVD